MDVQRADVSSRSTSTASCGPTTVDWLSTQLSVGSATGAMDVNHRYTDYLRGKEVAETSLSVSSRHRLVPRRDHPGRGPPHVAEHHGKGEQELNAGSLAVAYNQLRYLSREKEERNPDPPSVYFLLQ